VGGIRQHGRQRQLPERGQRQPVAAGAHGREGRHPDQAAGRVEHQERQRQLDHDRRGDAQPHVVGPQVEDHVEPGVTAQQRGGDQQAGDRDLAAAPEGPAGQRERREQNDVEAHPGEAPVRGHVLAAQCHDEHDDPGDQDDAGDGEEQRAEAAAPVQLQVEQRVRVIHRRQHASEFSALGRAHLAKIRLIDHASVLPLGRDRFTRVVVSMVWMTNSCTRMSDSARTRSIT
jgi:hypothetical protein